MSAIPSTYISSQSGSTFGRDRTKFCVISPIHLGSDDIFIGCKEHARQELHKLVLHILRLQDNVQVNQGAV